MSDRFSGITATPLAFGSAPRSGQLALYCAAIAAAILFPAFSANAQLPTLDVSKTASQTPTKKTDASSDSDSGSKISTKPPDIPVDQVIKKFGDRELEFKKERDNYTYTQTFVVQTIDFDGRADGEYRMTSDILFTPDGKRYEKVVSAPAPTLERIQLSQQDLDDVEHVQPFVLTSDELPKYDVTYVGRESLDELGTYVFDVKPKKIEKNQRYFQGRIWVDDRDLNIVKTDGKAVPDIIKHGNENIFPRFETFRENIEGHYWFPTYTRSDDELHFSTGAVHMRMTIRYANYKRFGATIKIGPAVETKDDKKPQN
ncbi:MAG TPA: hypothetical protein VH022_10535 [Candidatus Acidoferrum sp.]|jgi:hypothetical protein|nr:hypothetical protein [Candidatus Acidoferrum sp.]